jgi:putative ABC transport system permease protein
LSRFLLSASLLSRTRNARGPVLGEFGYAIRRLRNSPLFTVAAALTLSLAIGATASVFGLVEGVLLKALPYREPARVLTIWERNLVMHIPKSFVDASDFVEFRAQSTAFAEFAAGVPDQVTVTGQQEPERVPTMAVTPSYFSVLGINPVLGRPLAIDSSGPPEAVIAYDYWQRQFGGAPSVLGQNIIVDDTTYTIVGVMPRGVPGQAVLWNRLSLKAAILGHRGWHLIEVYGRLKPGVTQERAQRELTVIAGRLARAYPNTNSGWSVMTVPLPDELVGDVKPALVALLVAAACVLLIGAANLANLFLVRCLAREREIVLRTALGATRSRLVRELLAEATLLGVAAGAFGVALAYAGVRILRALAPPALPRLDQIGLDGRVVAFCAVTSLATVFIFGVVPAWHTSRSNLADLVKEAARGTSSARHHRLQDVLVVLQVAVALVLLTGAGLLLQSFARFQRSDLGYHPDGVLAAQIVLSENRYPTAMSQTAFASNVVDRLAHVPGVTAASVSSALPGGATIRWEFDIVGDPPPDPANRPTLRPIFVTPEYFRTLGIPMRRGRLLAPMDDQRSTRVAVIDEVLARRFFTNRDPIGRQVTFPGMPDSDTLTVIGVVAPVAQGGIVREDVPVLYAAYAQIPLPWDDMQVAMRTAGDPSARGPILIRTIHGLDTSVPVSDLKTMSQRVAQSVSTTSFSTFLASLFAVVAVTLGVVGIYSVLAYIVGQRRREIGIRLALGASRAQVMADVLRHGVALAGVGIAIGSLAAWLFTRTLAGAFPGLGPRDPSVFWSAALLFGIVAMAAATVPAYRTTRINPVVVLNAS